MNRKKKTSELPFERWSLLSARMMGLSPSARAEFLLARRVDLGAYDRAEAKHLAEIARRSASGDHALARAHGDNVRRQLANELVDEAGAANTTMEARIPAGLREPLPFSSGVFDPPPVSVREVDPDGETVPEGPARDDTLPFAQAGQLRFLRLDVFAAVSADLRRAPHERESVLSRHGLTNEAFLELAQLWAARFADNPALRASFESTVQAKLKGASR